MKTKDTTSIFNYNYDKLKEDNKKLLEALKKIKSAYDTGFVLSESNYLNIENLIK